MLTADDGMTDDVFVADALGELISNSKRGKRRRKAAEEGAIPNVCCFARHVQALSGWGHSTRTVPCSADSFLIFQSKRSQEIIM